MIRTPPEISELTEDYLWDPAAPSDDGVAHLETPLRSLRFEPRPLDLAAVPAPASPVRPWMVPVAAGTMAAAAILAWIALRGGSPVPPSDDPRPGLAVANHVADDGAADVADFDLAGTPASDDEITADEFEAIFEKEMLRAIDGIVPKLQACLAPTNAEQVQMTWTMDGATGRPDRVTIDTGAFSPSARSCLLETAAEIEIPAFEATPEPFTITVERSAERKPEEPGTVGTEISKPSLRR